MEDKKLPLHYSVYIFDDQQPLSNPKPMWLLVAKFNEPSCAEFYIRQKMLRDSYIKSMKIKFPDGKEKITKKEKNETY